MADVGAGLNHPAGAQQSCGPLRWPGPTIGMATFNDHDGPVFPYRPCACVIPTLVHHPGGSDLELLDGFGELGMPTDDLVQHFCDHVGRQFTQPCRASMR